MTLVLYTTAAACVWLLFWALGSKPFDAFLIGVLIMLVGTAHYLINPHLPGNRSED
jgi:uncharacterized membrane protein YbhN (UPF0104 family)